MINQRFILRMVIILGGAILLFVAYRALSGSVTPETTFPQVQPQLAGSVTLSPPPGCPSTFGITATLTPDTSRDEQAEVNCFAWQSFIALNWPADPNNPGQPDPNSQLSDFGAPGDPRPTVWQTYKAAQDVFLPGAQSPGSWNTQNTIPAACASNVKNAGLSRDSILYMTSKSSGGNVLDETVEAETDQILVDQTGRLIRFEKRINQVEFEYIVTNELYDADRQAIVATSTGIVLPPSSRQSDGSIEVKAAWRQLDGVDANLAKRYKQTQAFLYDASSQTCKGPIAMGLIALHIIRKTGSMHQLMWSTFEQVDNVPGSLAHPTGIPYTLYNPNCQKPAPCTPNATPQSTPRPPATPTYQPVQVVRTVAPPSDVSDLNTDVQAWIRTANPNSVWQYYQLVNVLWPQNNGNDPTRGAKKPINTAASGFTSSGPGTGSTVSNVALETYVQATSCIGCHASAAIARSTAVGCKPNLASDFSFVFDDADTTDHWRTNNCRTPTPTPSP